MTFYTTDPAIKGRFTGALRELADVLDQHPAIPVPLYGASIVLHADSADDGGRAQVNRIATLLGATVYDDTGHDGHYWAARLFGPIGYEITAITDTYTASNQALMSYRGSVTPDPDPGPAPGPDA
jgi:hypothetical protein